MRKVKIMNLQAKKVHKISGFNVFIISINFMAARVYKNSKVNMYTFLVATFIINSRVHMYACMN